MRVISVGGKKFSLSSALRLKRTDFKRQSGQSLIESLIALVIVALVLTSLVVAVLVAIKSSQFSKHKTQATFLSQEGIEWLRAMRQGLGWGRFNSAASLSGTEYCLQNLELEELLIPGECSDTAVIDNLYTRSVTLTTNLADPEVTVLVNVAWFEGEKQFSSPVTAVFSQWELAN